MSSITKVNVHVTVISFFDPKRNQVSKHKIIDKVTAINCRKLIKEMDSRNIFIEKETTIESFEVDTKALYALKGV